jgi:hypothetical protein
VYHPSRMNVFQATLIHDKLQVQREEANNLPGFGIKSTG